MPITLFDPSTQKPIVFDSGTEAKDAIMSGMANFDPNQDVYLKDGSGAIAKAKGSDALGYIMSPDSAYSLASDEDIYKKNRENKYGTAAQTALAATEGLVNAAGLGFGNALTKTGIDLLTPKGSDLAQKYGEAVGERAAENPMANLAGEVAGVFVDPLGAGAAISTGAGKVAGKVAATATKGASKVAPILEKVVAAPITQKAIERGTQFGIEGAGYGGAYEAGRQLTDDKPINGDAIISHMKDGAVLGTALGVGFGATEAAAAKALKATKLATKKYLDKITGAKGDQAGEVFSDNSVNSLNKQEDLSLGRNQKMIKLQEESEGVYKYTDQRREAIIDKIDPKANGLDLTNKNSVDKFGKGIGINDLSMKIKGFKQGSDTLDEFLIRAKEEQRIEYKLISNYPYMSAEDQAVMDQIEKIKDNYKYLKEPSETDAKILESVVSREKTLLESFEPPSLPKEKPQIKGFNSEGKIIPGDPIDDSAEMIAEFNKRSEAFKQAKDEVKRALSEFDYIINESEGKKVMNVYNENILPKTVSAKNLGSGVVPLDFEAAQMAKQYRMTPQAMIKKGNERLNEVAQFILDRYPQQGSMLKRATTSADHIFEEINTTKNKAINEINESIEQALNIGGTRQRITSENIANHIESEILPRFTDGKSGNPVAGLDKEYNAIKSFADGYKENGFTLNKYGDKVYTPLNVKELRELRINLDKVAKYNGSKLEPTAIQEAAREMRTWIEDEVMSRVGKLDESLLEKYKGAKKNYGLSIDAGKIVDAAAKKAAKDSNFSLFYSGVGSAVGASVAGVPGAIVGGLVGGAARNALREFSGALSVFMSRNLAKNVEQYEKLIDSTAKAFFRPLEAGTKAYIIVPKDNDKDIAKIDYKRLMAEISDREKYVEDFVDKNEDLFAQYPETSQKILDTTLRARDFLLTKIPQNPYVGNPWKEKTWEPSPLEINKYMRYREAVNNPSTILRQIRDGYVTPEAIEVLNMVYPETKDQLMKSFLDEASKAKSLPVSKRVELFKIFGIQLDTFMSGKGFIEAQLESNEQAHNSAQENGKQDFKPQNTFKTNIGKKDSTLGNSTLR